jgi:hypothetical protein
MAAEGEQPDVDMAGSDGGDSSESESDIEMDAAAEQQIMQLEEQLAARPHDYDKHVAVSTDGTSLNVLAHAGAAQRQPHDLCIPCIRICLCCS